MKRKYIAMVFILIVIFLGIMLQGCGGEAAVSPLPPEPSEVREEVEPVPVPDSQSSLLVTRFLMPHEFDRGGKSGWIPVWHGINIEIVDPEEVRDLELFIDISISPEAIENFNNINDLYPEIKPIGYFKITDEAGNPVTEFDPPLLMHLRYTSAAWEAAVQAGGDDVPKVFYLEREGDDWPGEWQEFSIDEANIYEPETEYSFGHILIELTELPDPNIGGPGD